MEDQPDIEFDDALVKWFLMLHRFKYLQWIILHVIRLRDKLDSYSFVRKPVTKEVDEMDNCHFRTLYGRSRFEDNYTDPDFLCSMQLNTNLNYYSVTEAIMVATRLPLAIFPCVWYALMYYHLGHENISPDAVLLLSAVIFIAGYVFLQCWNLWGERPWTVDTFSKIPFAEDGKVFCCCVSFEYLLIPILRTLTKTISPETVHAMCVFLFMMYLLSNDYGLKMSGIVSQPLSLNAAIFAMVCLVSQMDTHDQCWALMTFGTLCFACFPELTHIFWRWPGGTGILMVVTSIFCVTVSLRTSLVYAMSMFIITIVSPAYYIYSVQYKRRLYGPWDEAQLDLKVNMEEIEKGFARRSRRTSSSSSSSSSSQCSGPNIPGPRRNTHVEGSRIAEMEAKGIGQIL